MRVLISQDPYRDYNPTKTWEGIGAWPAQWVECPGAEKPFVAAYRLTFQLPLKQTVRAHVTADERYELYLDGQRLGRGPERGNPSRWYYETYDLPISAGQHTLVARVWALGEAAPFAQMSSHPGWLFSPEDEDLIALLATGKADWEVKLLPGYQYLPKKINQFFVTGDPCLINGALFPWGFETGGGDGWQKAVPFEPGVSAATYCLAQAYHELVPASLPPMLEVERRAGKVRFVEQLDSLDTLQRQIRTENHLSTLSGRWDTVIQGSGSLEVPAHTTLRAVIDLENYFCAYPQLTVSAGKGSIIRLAWSEALFREPEGPNKGNRDEIEGKYFYGIHDTFLPDGGNNRTFELLWWRAGRYLELAVQTGENALVLDRFSLRETRYPYEMESSFTTSDGIFDPLTKVAIRALQMCSHETYMDCPYYEQLMYVGDSRLETLVTYVTSHDERLPRKALRTFDASRIHSGLTQSRFPSRVMQIIPPFSLWWVAMVHDYALWRGDEAFTRSLMPGVRAVVEAFIGFRNPQGLVQAPQGWNFMDWAIDWKNWGVPPDGDIGVNGIINWQAVWVLSQASELETWFGDADLAARDQRISSELAQSATAAFWDEELGLFADDLSHQHFSEHAQCLAVLSGRVEPVLRERALHGLLNATDLTRTTIYFTHYLFETYRQAGEVSAIFDRLGLWFDHSALGMKTTLEAPEPSRSDCHAWGAHPVYHTFATLLGIRPAEMGFKSVQISPLPGTMHKLSGELVHPQGMIKVELEQVNGKLRASISLPGNLHGKFSFKGQEVDLHPGSQNIEI